jgi:hypothetical protein
MVTSNVVSSRSRFCGLRPCDFVTCGLFRVCFFIFPCFSSVFDLRAS